MTRTLPSRSLQARLGRRALHYCQLLADRALIVAAGPGARSLGDVTRVRTFRHYRDLAARFGLLPRSVLYVGANAGQELDLLAAAFPTSTIHCFEPQPGMQSTLRRRAEQFPQAQVHALALSDTTGSTVLRISTTHDQASSLLPVASAMAATFPHVGGWVDETVATMRLDEWVSEHPLDDDVIVKLDVQGAEGLVLDGAPELLPRVRMLIVEVAVTPTYTGAPSMIEMFPRLLAEGFAYAGEIGQVRDLAGTVVEFDAVFVRPR